MQNLFIHACQEKLIAAAAARVRRMCTAKKVRKGMNVPQWVVDEWKDRPKKETAKVLMDVNFDQAR